jgi:hypothetical protein
LRDSSFQPERASVAKHGNILSIYGSFQNKQQSHFCCGHPSLVSIENNNDESFEEKKCGIHPIPSINGKHLPLSTKSRGLFLYK